MRKLTWWFRIVGGFYLLLAVMNLYGTFVDPAYFKQVLPFADTDLAVRAFVIGWSPFAFEILGLGTFMLWASRRAGQHVSAVWLIVWLELLHGIVDDLYLIANGFNAGEYLPFIAIHVIIIVTGIVFARQVQAQRGATRIAAGVLA